MRQLRTQMYLAFLCAIFFGRGATASSSATHVTLAESALRSFASQTLDPVYPVRSSDKKCEGVAVAWIVVNPSGEVESVSILQSPEPEASKEMAKSLRSWHFKSEKDGDGNPIYLEGKITYYFLHGKGGARGTVSSPDSTFFVGSQTTELVNLKK